MFLTASHHHLVRHTFHCYSCSTTLPLFSVIPIEPAINTRWPARPLCHTNDEQMGSRVWWHQKFINYPYHCCCCWFRNRKSKCVVNMCPAHYVWLSQFWSHFCGTNALFASKAKINVVWNFFEQRVPEGYPECRTNFKQHWF